MVLTFMYSAWICNKTLHCMGLCSCQPIGLKGPIIVNYMLTFAGWDVSSKNKKYCYKYYIHRESRLLLP